MNLSSNFPSTSIPVHQPFDFTLTVGHQTYYRGRAGADLFVEGTYYRALRRDDFVVVASATPADDDTLAIRLPHGGSNDDIRFAAQAMKRLLGLDINLAGFYRLLAGDEILNAAVGGLRGLRPTRSENMFEALVMAIVAQQISSNVASNIRDSLVGAFGDLIEVEGYELHAFPSAAVLLGAGPDALRTHKLSARKIEYIRDVARRTVDGRLSAERFAAMDDEEAVAELTAIRGVGRWTAEWVLLRALGRTDLLPAGDVALRKLVADLYFGGASLTEQQLAEFGLANWSPYRSFATTYLFARLRQQRAALV